MRSGWRTVEALQRIWFQKCHHKGGCCQGVQHDAWSMTHQCGQGFNEKLSRLPISLVFVEGASVPARSPSQSASARCRTIQIMQCGRNQRMARLKASFEKAGRDFHVACSSSPSLVFSDSWAQGPIFSGMAVIGSGCKVRAVRLLRL